MAREVYSPELDFTIDTSISNYISYGDYHSYTFPVSRTVDNGLLENVMLSLQADGTYLAHLISYDITEAERELLLNNGQVPSLHNKMNSTVLLGQEWPSNILARGGGSCWDYYIYAPMCSYNKHTAEQVANGANCVYVNDGGVIQPAYTVFIITDCDGTNPGGDFPSDPDNPGYDYGWPDTGGGGPYDPNNPDPVPNEGDNCSDGLSTGFVDANGNCIPNTTAPIANPRTPAQRIEVCLGMSIPWLNNIDNSQTVAQMDAYLTQNQCSEEAQAFAEAVLDAGPDAEVDWEDLLIIDPTFKNNQKAKCVYDRMKSLNGSVFSDLLSQFDNSKNAKLTFKVANIPQTSPTVYHNAKTLPRFGGGNLRTFDIILDEQFVQNASLIEISLTLVHEMVHAEIMERCIQLGIITALGYDSNWEASLSFSNGAATTTNFPSILFALLVSNYSNYLGTNPNSSSNWQHDLYNVTNYRTRIAQNLSQVHPLLNDTTNPFENNLNNGAIINLTMSEYFNLISWLGLEGTQEYNNLSPLEQTKKAQAFNQTELYYNDNCN